MNYAIHRISLDVNDDSPSQITIAAKQGDSAKTLIISLLEDKKNYKIAQGSTAVFIAKKSNGIWLNHPCEIDYENNKVVYTFHDSTVVSPCTMECEIHLSFANTATFSKTVIDEETGEQVTVEEQDTMVKKLTTSSFFIAVHDTVLSGASGDTEEEVQQIPSLITEGRGVIEETRALKASTEEATEAANSAASEALEAKGKAELATKNANTATTNADNYITSLKNMVSQGAFDGADGISVTHSWNGTKLVLKSASGTTETDLRGAKGDTTATLIEVNKDNSGYYDTIQVAMSSEEKHNKYKIYCNSGACVSYLISIPRSGGYLDLGVDIPLSNGSYRDYCVFELLRVEATVSKTGVSSYSLKMYYELNGVIGSIESNGTFSPDNSYSHTSYPIWVKSLRLTDVNKAYFYNDHLTVVAVDPDRLEAMEGRATAHENDISELKTLVGNLMYTPISISSFTHDKSIVEYGTTVEEVVLSWVTNKKPTTLKIDDKPIDVNATSATISNLTITKDSKKEWTLTAIDERNATDEKTTSITFQNGIYYGTATKPNAYDSAFVTGLSEKILSGVKSRTIELTTGEGEYMFYCLPKRLGECSFKVGGFDGGITKDGEISVTNSSGYTESYYIYCSDNANLGKKKIEIS